MLFPRSWLGVLENLGKEAMDQAVEAFTLVLVIANGIFSYRGFRSRRFFDSHIFWVGKILDKKEYTRIFTSGFLHANWGHLIFNMFALYSFSIGVGAVFGFIKFVIIYFASLAAGNLLALLIHREDSDYRAVGASGAVCGVIFASILLFPDSSVSFLFLPLAIPSWLFGIGFVLVSIYGIRSRLGNIGHEAHLGGAITGVIVTSLFNPALLQGSIYLAASLVVPSLVFLFLMVRHPNLIRLKTAYGSRKKKKQDDERRKLELLQEEVHYLLDKVNEKGYENLNWKEKRRLKKLSKEIERLQH